MKSPSDRGTVPFDVFQGVPPRRLKLLAPPIVDEEEKDCLSEVAISSRLEFIAKQQNDAEVGRLKLPRTYFLYVKILQIAESSW